MKLTEEEKKKVEDNLPLVTYILKKYNWTYGDYDDYFQVGAYGLCKAVRRYDESRGTAFSTYASNYILGHVMQYYRDFMKGPIKPKRIGQTSKQNVPEYLYIDGMFNEEGQPTGYDVIEVYESEEDEIIANLALEKLKQNLTDVEKKIFDLAYQGKVQIEIAERVNISQAQVSRIKKKIKHKMNEFLRS